jgi:hypothetical protein
LIIDEITSNDDIHRGYVDAFITAREKFEIIDPIFSELPSAQLQGYWGKVIEIDFFA